MFVRSNNKHLSQMDYPRFLAFLDGRFLLATFDIAATVATQPRGKDLTFVREEHAAAAPQMLDALTEVNDYLTRYEAKEQVIDYIFRSRHSVRGAIANASGNTSA